MKHLKTYEELSDESLEDLKAKISDYFDEEKKDGLYVLLSILKDKDPESYEEYKKKYDELK
jgi:folylpolyglutamate synthase/dihydropteroate synthase